MSDTRAFWNERFGASDASIYGDVPNDFLSEHAQWLTGRVLSLGEGEGRNAVFLARRGLDVTALDISEVGLAKTEAFARKHGVTVHTLLADLTETELEPGSWGGIISIWCHLPVAAQPAVIGQVVRGLAPGGVFILEAYTPRQLAFGTGGPKSADLLYEPTALKEQLVGLEIELCAERERHIDEGPLHRGTSAVVQVVARKPS